MVYPDGVVIVPASWCSSPRIMRKSVDFAVAVPAHEPDALARVDREADTVEEQLFAVGFLYVRDLKHLVSLVIDVL